MLRAAGSRSALTSLYLASAAGLVCAVGFSASLFTPESAFAQDATAKPDATAKVAAPAASGTTAPVKSTTATEPSTAAGATTAAAQQPIPKDPQGIRGISPFWEHINQGDAAYLAQDFEAAEAHYKSAVTFAPKNPIGHLRGAEVAIRANNFEMAEEFLKSALRFSTDDIRYQAQATFLLAGLRERSGAFDDALTAWKDYKLLEAKLPPAGAKAERGPLPPRIYVTTVDQRTEAITKRHKLGKDYAAIKERFQQDVKEAEAATGETAGGKPATP